MPSKKTQVVSVRLPRESMGNNYVTPEKLRQYIKEGYCFWCNTGGWRRLAQHTSMIHHIYANDIREMAVLLKRTPVCIVEESKRMSDRTLKLLEEGKREIPNWRLGNKTTHEYSEAGLISMRRHQKRMIESLTEDVKIRCAKRTKEVLSKPHQCLVCGKIIPRAKPLCCSPECVRIRRNTGAKAATTRQRLAGEKSEYKLRMSQVPQHQKRKKPHFCSVCGKYIPKSRPRKYCSPKCASNPSQFPIEDIKVLYLNGMSLTTLAKSYNCCDTTIRRHLIKNGVTIRNK